MDLVEENASQEFVLQCIKWCVEHDEHAALKEHLRLHYCKVKQDLSPLLFDAVSKQKVDAFRTILASLDYGILTQALLNKLLCNAGEIGNTEIVKDLIDKGADVDCNFHGKPLLHVAASYGNTEVVTIFVNVGSDIRSRDRTGDGVLHSILTSQSTLKGYSVRHAINLGADPLVKSSSGKLPIHLAAKNAPDVLVELIREGIDVNIVDDVNHDTPLHIACSAACRETILILIQSGGILNLVNKHGQTPLAKLLKFTNNGHDFHTKTRLDIARTLISLGFHMNCQKVFTQYHKGRDKAYDRYISLKLSLKSPASLQHLARIAVRDSLQDCSVLVKDISKLEIPINLKSLLMFHDVTL